MPELRFVQVDAFADKPFTGNPAAVIPLEQWLPEETMQAIAEENNLAVILALVLDQYAGLTGADPLFGILIALWLLWGAWRASARAVDQLMDKEWPEEKRRRFVDVAGRHPALKGLHDLRTRTSGAHDFVQFHVWVDPAMTVAAAHRVMDEVEHKLEAEFPGVEILIHIDPEGQVDQPGNPLAETDLTTAPEEIPGA